MAEDKRLDLEVMCWNQSFPCFLTDYFRIISYLFYFRIITNFQSFGCGVKYFVMYFLSQKRGRHNRIKLKMPAYQGMRLVPWFSTSVIFGSCGELTHCLCPMTIQPENWGFYTLLTSLPMFMRDVLEYSLDAAGILLMSVVVQVGENGKSFFLISYFHPRGALLLSLVLQSSTVAQSFPVKNWVESWTNAKGPYT